MNYYYDIILNWNELNAYEFYEWNDFDYLELIKKIPLIKVKHKVLVDLIDNNIKVEKEFLNYLEDKTLISAKKTFKKIPYAALFTDTKNVIAIEFNQDGLSISRSNLLLDDELNVLEATYGIKEINFNYEIINKIIKDKELRQISEAKKLINLEINNLYKSKDINKLKYLFYEYKKENINDIEYIYKYLNDEINTKFNQEILKLYYIIKLSYHKV